MSEPTPTITIGYSEIEVNGMPVANLEQSNCCGLREFSSFQENGGIGDHLAEKLWAWFAALPSETRVEYGLEVTRALSGITIYPSYTEMSIKFVELFPEFSFSNGLARLCYVLSTIGKEWTPLTAITILALVENWDNAYPIMDALVEGGWQLSVDTVLNTNSGNDISLWTYRRKEAV